MGHIIKNGQIVEDYCRHLGMDDTPPEGDITVPLERWRRDRERLIERTGRVGVRLQGDDDPTSVVSDLPQLDLVALEFPRCTDGRCYSHARLLRERYSYPGEIRAVGEVLRDQLYFMERCGINAFELGAGCDLDAALQAFTEITVQYQPAADDRRPVYRFRA